MGQHDAVLSGDTTTIDLSTAENWATKTKLLQGLEGVFSGLSEHDLAYSSGIGGCPTTRKLIADLINNRFQPSIPVKNSHVVLAAGGSFALTALIEQICDPGDGILIATPYWAGLDISISVHAHATVVPVHVPLIDFFNTNSIPHYESALERSLTPIKAVLVCNPHNPLGQCYPRETLDALLEFCKRHELHYISDEVYALSAHQPFPGGFHPFVSALQWGERETRAQVHIIYSLSKDFGCNGIRIGVLITQFNDAVRLSSALSVHSQVSSLSTVLASKTILQPTNIDTAISHGAQSLMGSYKMIQSFLENAGMEYIPVAFGMFVFTRLGRVSNFDAETKLLRCLKSRGVSVSSGSSYHFQELGWFRICYAVPSDQLEEGLRRIGLGIQDFHETFNVDEQ
ncbi:hypothetical protein CBS147332_8381 [Penicillium roqueforti]|nr:hypothetical protein CBS147332_8381 [Penicillium roqueforti]KAI3100053.1 hypothetical protein CBS147331_8424 [Penicillium roqueforti]